MEQQKKASPNLAGFELARDKGVLSYCQGSNIEPSCHSCKIISAIILWQRRDIVACVIVSVDQYSRKLLPAPLSLNVKLHILQHALGLDKYGRGTRYRNHFVADQGSPDWSKCQELVGLGLMVRYEPREIFGGMHCFVVTEQGIVFVEEMSPQPPKLTMSQKRYRDYLKNGDFYESFGEYLKENERLRKMGAQCYA